MRHDTGARGEIGDPQRGLGTDVTRNVAAIEDPGAHVNLRLRVVLRGDKG